MMGWLRGQVAKVIFGVLLLAFLAWIVLELGMQGRMGTAAGSAAVVNGDKVSSQEFWQLYNQEVEETWGSLRGSMSEADEKILRGEVLNKLIDQVLAWQEARRMKYAVSRREVQASLRGYQAFLGPQGQFDPARYVAFLSRLGLSQEVFEQQQERSISAGRSEGLIREAVRVTDDELWLEYLRWHRRMKAAVMSFPFSEARPKVTVTASEVREYWQENRRTYERPERVRIRHIVAAVNPQGGPEALAQARAKIDSIVADLKKGSDFAELARRRSDDANTQPRGGDLGWHPKGELIPEYDTVAFKLKTGQVSEVFQTRFGYHLLKCDAHQREEKPTFEEKRESIRTWMVDTRARAMELEKARRALWLSRTNKDLVKVAELGAFHRPVELWLQRGKTLGEALGTSSPTVDSIIVALAPLEPGDVTEIVETKDGFYIAQLKGEKHARAPETGYMRERGQLESAVLARKRKEVAVAWLAGLRAKAKIRITGEGQ